jgi:hypothetical protein
VAVGALNSKEEVSWIVLCSSKELFYVDSSNRVVSVEVTSRGESLKLGQPQTLKQLPLNSGNVFHVFGDGQRFLMAIPPQQNAIGLNLVVNCALAGAPRRNCRARLPRFTAADNFSAQNSSSRSCRHSTHPSQQLPKARGRRNIAPQLSLPRRPAQAVGG